MVEMVKKLNSHEKNIYNRQLVSKYILGFSKRFFVIWSSQNLMREDLDE